MSGSPTDDSGRHRLRRAARDIGIGFGSAAVVMLLFLRGTVATLDTAVVAIAAFVTVWVMRAPVHRLFGPSGRTVFLGLATGIMLAAAAISVRPSASAIGAFLILLVGTVSATLRRLAHG